MIQALKLFERAFKNDILFTGINVKSCFLISGAKHCTVKNYLLLPGFLRCL
ncbi:hypothetical protein NBO_15g0016 [Nosema bombycis CQ1]|uniref:Uncharacterized protein n=1 Tax=Nosema bombycis (strain CQ1 / CVCC 102059) TaxID=578461 RepID=R0MA13_NOSB1|nr:hypothetical protein NBO_15g0016 [Nosema bombycis CQ1]|eukprot:EOB14804.1 hypothetical protein NBO_15g0016 [Nosema bombycis CQ1]